MGESRILGCFSTDVLWRGSVGNSRILGCFTGTCSGEAPWGQQDLGMFQQGPVLQRPCGG